MLQVAPREMHAAEFQQARERFAVAAAGEVDGRRSSARSDRRTHRRAAVGNAARRAHRRSGAAAGAAVPHGAGRQAVRGRRAAELAGAVVEQRRQVRAAERLRRRRRRQAVFTHGVELGVARASSRDLREATRTLTIELRAEQPRPAPGLGVRATSGCRSAAASAVSARQPLASSAAPNASASTRRSSPTAISSTWRRSCPRARADQYAPASIASRARSAFATPGKPAWSLAIDRNAHSTGSFVAYLAIY